MALVPELNQDVEVMMRRALGCETGPLPDEVLNLYWAIKRPIDMLGGARIEAPFVALIVGLARHYGPVGPPPEIMAPPPPDNGDGLPATETVNQATEGTAKQNRLPRQKKINWSRIPADTPVIVDWHGMRVATFKAEADRGKLHITFADGKTRQIRQKRVRLQRPQEHV